MYCNGEIENTIPALQNIKYIQSALNDYKKCVLSEANNVYCTGSSIYETNIAKIRTSEFNHICTISNSYILKCTGTNTNGMFGSGTTIDHIYTSPIIVESSVLDVTITDDHMCILFNNGYIECAGNGIYGKLGNGEVLNSNEFVRVDSLTAIKLKCKGNTCCAINRDFYLLCWGFFNFWLDRVEYSPVLMSSTKNVIDFTIGDFFLCIIERHTHKIYCMGWNSNGQFGNGNFASSSAGIFIESFTGYTAVEIYSNGKTICIKTEELRIFCAGITVYGIGATVIEDEPIPMEYMFPSNPPTNLPSFSPTTKQPPVYLSPLNVNIRNIKQEMIEFTISNYPNPNTDVLFTILSQNVSSTLLLRYPTCTDDPISLPFSIQPGTDGIVPICFENTNETISDGHITLEINDNIINTYYVYIPVNTLQSVESCTTPCLRTMNEDINMIQFIISSYDHAQRGIPIYYSIIEGPFNGTLIQEPNFVIKYTPNPNFFGRDYFKFKPVLNTTIFSVQTYELIVNPIFDDIDINISPNIEICLNRSTNIPLQLTNVDRDGYIVGMELKLSGKNPGSLKINHQGLRLDSCIGHTNAGICNNIKIYGNISTLNIALESLFYICTDDTVTSDLFTVNLWRFNPSDVYYTITDNTGYTSLPDFKKTIELTGQPQDTFSYVGIITNMIFISAAMGALGVLSCFTGVFVFMCNKLIQVVSVFDKLNRITITPESKVKD